MRETVFNTITEQFGCLDVVFANAGIANAGSIAEATEELFDMFAGKQAATPPEQLLPFQKSESSAC